MRFNSDNNQWARETFGHAQLGDARRSARLVRIATDMAANPELSINAISTEDDAATTAAHRFVRNPDIEATTIAEAGFRNTTKVAENTGGTLLAIEDTTTLSFAHSVTDELGGIGAKQDSKNRGWLVHSTMLVDAESGTALGLIDQKRWTRPGKERGKSHRRKKRRYKDKESFKWEEASRRIAKRIDDTMAQRLVSVADRESDVYEYLQYKCDQNQSFVIRATRNRRLQDADERLLWEQLEQSPIVGTRKVLINQRGGKQKRKARIAETTIKSCRVRLNPPPRAVGKELYPIEVWAVYVCEPDPPEGKEALEWMLLTDLDAETFEKAEQVVEHYEQRWLIEDFHLVWKQGTKVEERRQQHAPNLEKVAVIAGFVAVRMLQMRSLAATEPDISCRHTLNDLEWICLWASVEKTPPPEQPPDVKWAWYALAKLGGWRDTQQTGRVGWISIWRGWARMSERVIGLKLARDVLHNPPPPEM